MVVCYLCVVACLFVAYYCVLSLIVDNSDTCWCYCCRCCIVVCFFVLSVVVVIIVVVGVVTVGHVMLVMLLLLLFVDYHAKNELLLFANSELVI